MNIGGVEIGSGHPCRFVFEVSNAHNGSYDRALRLVLAAKQCGADFVKFQCYSPDELVALRGDGPAPDPWGSQGWTMRTLYEKARTPFGWFPGLFAYAREIGIVPFSSVFGPESLAALESVDCPAYKIARLDNQHTELAKAALALHKPVIISRTRGDWTYATAFGAKYLYCPPGYPTPIEAVTLPDTFSDCTDFLGLSSHCLDPRLPVAAVARGCKLIEIHGMLDDEPSELESNVSLTATEFAAMIADVRATEVLLGN